MSESVTVVDFETAAANLKKLRDEQDGYKAQVKEAEERIVEAEKKLMAMMEEADISKYVSKSGTVYTSVHESVAVPKGDAKQVFFDYLRENGLYDEVVTVNSQWLNGYFRRERERAIEEGDITFNIPGLDNPHTTVRLNFRKG